MDIVEEGLEKTMMQILDHMGIYNHGFYSCFFIRNSVQGSGIMRVSIFVVAGFTAMYVI